MPDGAVALLHLSADLQQISLYLASVNVFPSVSGAAFTEGPASNVDAEHLVVLWRTFQSWHVDSVIRVQQAAILGAFCSAVVPVATGV